MFHLVFYVSLSVDETLFAAVTVVQILPGVVAHVMRQTGLRLKRFIT